MILLSTIHIFGQKNYKTADDFLAKLFGSQFAIFTAFST